LLLSAKYTFFFTQPNRTAPRLASCQNSARLQKAKQAAAAAPSFAGSSPRYGAPSTGGASFHYDYSGDASGSGSGGNSPRGRH
jgi:hypothetical protein